MSMSHEFKQLQWKRKFQQRVQYAVSSSNRSNVKAILAGHYAVVKIFGKTVPLPGVSPLMSCSHSVSSNNSNNKSMAYGDAAIDRNTATPKESIPQSKIPRTAEENRRRYAKRKQTKIQLLVNHNFSPATAVLVTLTFDDCQQSIDYVVKQGQLLFKRLKSHVPGVKYIAVPERHESGGWHIHLILDRELPLRKKLAKPYVDKGKIKSKSGSWESLWKLGIVHQKRLNQGGTLGASIAGYVMKNAAETDMNGHHTEWKSDNLEKPVEINGQDAVDLLHSFVSEDLTPCYGYHCDNCGHIETMDVFEFCLDPEAAMLNKAWWRFKKRAA